MRVLKIGGNELHNPAFLSGLATAVTNIKEKTGQPVIIVHGGGKAISDLQTKLGLTAVKIDGVRVTDPAGLEVAQMVLSGHSNKIIVQALLAEGVDAIGLSGVDGGLLRCEKKHHPTADLGLVGEITTVRANLLHQLAQQGITAVISPISLGHDGQIYNVNADDAASAVAFAVGAIQIDFISNVPGVLHNDLVIPSLTIAETTQPIEAGVIREGMVVKVQSALNAVTKGVAQARIVDLVGLTKKQGTVFSEQG